MTTPEAQGSVGTWPHRIVPILAILAVAGIFVVSHINAYTKISPFDEGVHFDYVVKASHGEIVQKGDTLGQVAMKEIACRQIDLPTIEEPKCMAPGSYVPGDFVNQGYNSADIHPPTYYLITGVISRGLVAIGIADTQFVAARLVGVLWFGLGLLSVWYLGREVGARTAPLVVVLAMLAASPTFIHASATVNNDAASLLAGGGLAWLTLRWERGRVPTWLLALAAFVVPTFKATNIVVVGMCALYLLMRTSKEVPSGWRNRRVGIAVLLAAGMASVISWIAIHAALAEDVVTPIDRFLSASSLSLEDVLQRLTALVTPVSYGLPTTVLGGSAYGAVGGVLGILMIAGAIAPLLRGSLTEPREHLAAASGFTMLVGGSIFVVANYLLLGEVLDVSPRYGLTLVAALAVAVAVVIRSKGALRAIGAFATFQAAYVLGTLLTT